MAPVLLTGLVAACLLLALAGGQHLRRARQFASLLLAHRVLPQSWTPVVARVFPPGELILGATGLGAVALAPVASSRAALVVVAFCVSSLCTVLACYQLVQHLVSPGLSCGCFGESSAVGWSGVVINLGLAGWAALAAYADVPASPGHVVTAAIAGAVLALGVRRLGQSRTGVPHPIRRV